MAVKTCPTCGSAIGASRPVHTHFCNGGESDPPHQWECDSAYCNTKERECVDHGGEAPKTNY